MFIPVNGGQGISRPFVVGLILLLVFLGMQSDFVPSRPADSAAADTGQTKDSTKERVSHLYLVRKSALLCSNLRLLHAQIILELSKSNEKLEVRLVLLLSLLLQMFLGASTYLLGAC